LGPQAGRREIMQAISELKIDATLAPSPPHISTEGLEPAGDIAAINGAPEIGIVTTPTPQIPLQKEAAKVPDIADTSDTRKMRILAAEDNKTNRLVFSKMVGKLNVDLEFAENGKEAVEKWQEFQPDLVFMDISMPLMDGKEATQEIRKLETLGRHTPIVALTAHAMSGDDQEILSAGLDFYLTKPLRKMAIFEQISNAAPDGTEEVFD